MSRNLARLKYAPALLAGLACMAASSLAAAEPQSGAKLSVPTAMTVNKPAPAAQAASAAPSLQSLSVSGARAASSQAAAGPAPTAQSISATGARAASSQAAAKSAPSSQSLSASAAQSAAAQSAPAAQLAIAGASEASAAAGSTQAAPARMQLASLSNTEAMETQSALVRPNFVAASQSLAVAKKAAQWVNAARKSTKLASATYSSKAAVSNSIKVQPPKLQKKSSLKSTKTGKKAASK